MLTCFRHFFQRKFSPEFVFSACLTLSFVFLMKDYKNLNLGQFAKWSYFDRLHMSVLSPICEKSLPSLLSGKWIQRNLTSLEDTEINLFLLKVRSAHRIPTTLQRSDLKCGNVTFDWLMGGWHPLLWFRALCSPQGDTPCCSHGRCVQASAEQCTCEQCYDMRQEIHAEYSSWIPSNPNCPLNMFSHEEVCSLLKGGSIYFIGDSFVRHVYTAMMLILTNDFEYGALPTSTSLKTRTECKGMYMFTEHRCRIHLTRSARVCQGTVSVNMLEQVSSAYGPSFPMLARTLANSTNSLLVIGIGIHENYNAVKTTSKFLTPLLNAMHKNKQRWPRVLWTGPHAPGLLKTPRVPQQDSQHVLEYNAAVGRFLAAWNIPVMDTFNMTKGVMSFDGAHYGVGVNRVKAMIILNYIQELKEKGVWL